MRYLALIGLVAITLVSCNPTDPSFPQQDQPFASYTCTGSCTPVRFEVQAPSFLHPFTQLYLVGSFNEWIGADSVLAMERQSDNEFWAEVALPEGDSVAYRYVLGYGTNRPVIGERGENRSLRVQKGRVLSDSVAAWDSDAGARGYWQWEDLDRFQKDFIVRRFHRYTDHVGTTSDLDALFRAAETTWAEEARLQFPGFERLTSGTYLYIHAAQQAGGLSMSAFCRLLTEYTVPAFQKDLEYIKAPVREEKGGLLHGGRDIMWGAHCGDVLSDEAWRAVEETYRTLPPLVAAYLALDDLHPIARKSLESFRSELATMRLDYDFVNAVRQGDLSRAHRLMMLAFTDPTRERAYSTYMAKHLAAQYAEQGKTTDALGVLDFTAQQTMTLHLPTDTLRDWYRTVAGAVGVAHFQQLDAMLSREKLEGRGDPIDLSGTYLDLTSGSPFDLATLKGKTVLIDFWTTYCGPCRAEIPDLIAFQERIQHRDEVVFISVSEDAVDPAATPRTELEELIVEKGINYVVLYDTPDHPISRHFDVKGYPTKYVLDENSRIVSGTGDFFSVLEE